VHAAISPTLSRGLRAACGLRPHRADLAADYRPGPRAFVDFLPQPDDTTLAVLTIASAASIMPNHSALFSTIAERVANVAFVLCPP